MPEEAVETLRLKVGEPGEPETENPTRENIIRYVPKDQRGPDSGSPTESPGNDGVPDDMIDSDGLPQGVEKPPSDKIPRPSEEPQDASEEAGAQLWHSGQSVAQLSLEGDSRLADAIYTSMVETRNNVLSQIGNEFENAPMYAAQSFEQRANSELRKQMSRGRFRDSVTPVVEELVSDDAVARTRFASSRRTSRMRPRTRLRRCSA